MKNKRKGFVGVVAVIIVALGILGFGTYKAFNKSGIEIKTADISTNNGSSDADRSLDYKDSPGTVSEPTIKNWKKYRNEKYGINFEFKYPSEYLNVRNGNSNEWAEFSKSDSEKIGAYFFTDLPVDLDSNKVILKYSSQDVKHIVIDGKRAIFFKEYVELGQRKFAATARIPFDSVSKLNKVLQISIESNDEINDDFFNKILSTVKLNYVDTSELVKKDWGMSFNIPARYVISENNADEIKIRNLDTGDIMTVSNIVGSIARDTDAKFGDITYFYDENNQKWMFNTTDNIFSQTPKPVIYTADSLPGFGGTKRWKTYFIPLSKNQILKLNITGSGETRPLDELVKTIKKL